MEGKTLNKSFMQKPLEYFSNHKLQGYAFVATVSLLIILIITLATFNYFVHTPKQKTASSRSFTVTNGQGLRAISANLKKENFIVSDLMFMLYMKLSGLSGTIQAGDYNISSSMEPLEIADILTKGKVASKTVTIPEGWTVAEIGAYLEKQGIVKAKDFEAAASQSYDYNFLAGKPSDVSLEGFLFPDTYQVSVKATPSGLVKMMLDNFGKRVTSDMRAAAEKSGLGLYGTVTLASVVEKEANKPADRKLVAGIFISRINEGMRLQSDVTVAYALGEDKKDLTADDLKLDSPYNTYVVDGLPKGPICNPGLESINSVIYPEITAFRFFIAANDQMYFANTIEEHNANVAKYLR